MSYQNKVAFVVGNGPSRLEVDLNELVGKAPIYGCNALYRDFDKWDYLVSIDQGMVEEVRKAEGAFGTGTIIVPPADKHYEPLEYSPARRRNNAGMVAMDIAIDRGFNTLYLLGIDFILKGDIATGNVYEGTENYGPETHATGDDNYHRMQYLSWFARKNENVKFVFVVPDTIPMRPIDATNVVGMKMSTFKSKLK
jgi:hypothetical protein